MLKCMRQDDAISYIVDSLRGRGSGNDNCRGYGYDLYLPHLLKAYVWSVENLQKKGEHFWESSEMHRRTGELSPVFYGAAWDLCRRGIIRPGIRSIGEQSTSDGGSGNGYSVTPFGKAWLEESHDDTFVPTEPERFGQMLAKHKERFGPAFQARSQEAVRCYGAHAYLACCAMCGAAAESIFLSIAIAKLGDETGVLKKYNAAGGRGRIQQIILGQAAERSKRTLGPYFDLLSYWRDESAHGAASRIDDIEAHTALALLLRLSHASADMWTELIGPVASSPGI